MVILIYHTLPDIGYDILFLSAYSIQRVADNSGTSILRQSLNADEFVNVKKSYPMVWVMF